jgi:hypothetical protein
MSSGDGVYDALTITRQSIEDALGPLVAAQQGGNGAVRLYYQRQTADRYPCVVHQSQDNGGTADHRIGAGGWSGLWTLRALATDSATAEAWLAAVRAGMDDLTLPAGYSGYTIDALFDRPLALPPSENIHQAAAIYRVRIART